MPPILSAVALHAEAQAGDAALLVLREGSWTVLTYADLLREANRWAALYQSRRYAPGSVAFIVLKHRCELYPAFLGAMRAGLVPSFLPYPTPKQDAETYWRSHRTLLERVRPACIISYGDNVAQLRGAAGEGCDVLDVDALPPDPPDDYTLPPLAAVEGEERIALLQHSSGTTGLKKGVALTHGQLRRQFEAYAATVDIGRGSTVITWLPLYHDMGLISSFLLPLSVGARIVSIDAFDWLARPDSLLTLAEEHRATHCWLPNFAFNHLARTRNRRRSYDLSSFRALVSCSEPAKPETMQRFIEAFAETGLSPASLRVCYAMAETVFAVTQTAAGKPARELRVDAARLAGERRVDTSGEDQRAIRLLSCGAPVAGVELRIVCHPGEDVGEIELRGEFLFSEYFSNPAATAECFDEGWYRTGDLGFLRDGELYVCGRIKELLIVHGRNYYATDIEEIVGQLPGAKPGRAVAFGLFDRVTASEEVVVLVESEAETEAARETLAKAVRVAVFDRLELTVRKVEILPLGRIIKTTSGKISRGENRDRYQANADQDANVGTGPLVIRS